MKKNILLKTILLFILFSSLFTYISCGNLIQSKTSSDKVLLKLSVSDAKRTVMPACDVTKLTDFVLYSIDEDNKKISLASFDNYEAVQNATVELDDGYARGAFNFVMAAKNGNVEYESSPKFLNIKFGENNLSFVLSLKSLGDGNGSLSYTFDFSTATTGTSVKKAELNIECLSDTSIEDIDIEYSEENLSSKKIVYTSDAIHSGIYKITVSLYGDESSKIELLKWHELLHVAQGLTSSSTTTIDSFNEVYTITFDPRNGEALTQESVTRRSFELGTENPEKDGYIFINWYIDENTPFTLPVTENVNVYAKYELPTKADGSYNVTSQTIGSVLDSLINRQLKNVKINLLGEYDENMVKDALEHVASSDMDLTLDMSETTSFDTLSVELFQNNPHIFSVTLPSELRFIESGKPETEEPAKPAAFDGCSALTEIIVPSKNNYFKSVDGVLYSKDGKILYAYPASKEGSSYTIPDDVEKVCYHAFYGAKSLTSITANTTSGKWYSSISENENVLSIIAYADEITISDISNAISSGPEKTFYHVFIENLLVTEITVNTTLSNNLQNDDYIKANIADNNFHLFKIPTTENKLYSITWFDSCSIDVNLDVEKFSGIPEDLCDCEIFVLNNDFTCNKDTDDDFNVTFVANSNCTFIGVKGLDSYESGTCAFGIQAVDMSLKSSITVNNSSGDLIVKKRKDENGNDVLYIPNREYFDKFAWYLDNIPQEKEPRKELYSITLNSASFYGLTPGTHLITILARRRSSQEYYSYSEYIELR